MTMQRIPGRPPPNTAAASFLGRLLGPRASPSAGTSWRTRSIDPGILEATMTTGGWVSWEMVHFISEIASERNEK